MRWIDGDGYDALVQRRSAISGPCPALAVAVLRGLWARGQELQVAGAEEVVEAVLERLGHLEANAMGSEKNSAAVFEDEGELQLAVAGRGTDDLADFFEHVGSVLALVDPHDDTGGIARIELVERDQLVNDEVSLFAPAAIDDAAN